MNLIDMHCDTISLIHTNSKGHSFQNDGTTNSSYDDLVKEKMSLRKNDLHVDLEKLEIAKAKAQFFALFVEFDYLKKIKQTPYEYFNLMYNTLIENLNENKDKIVIARNYDEMEKNFKENKISAFLTIEEGGAIEGKLERIEEVYNKGIRLITLSWNHENELCYPNCNPKFMKKGLKNKGIEAVERMNELGMLVDVSHMSDGGFWDVVKYSKKPFVASHSNARALASHPRNLTDDMIKAVANAGGTIGINYFGRFLSNRDDNVSKVSDIVNHIKYIRNIGGDDVLSLGGDFDGVDSTLEMANIGQMDKLLMALKTEGFKEDFIEKLWEKNITRVIKDVLR